MNFSFNLMKNCHSGAESYWIGCEYNFILSMENPKVSMNYRHCSASRSIAI